MSELYFDTEILKKDMLIYSSLEDLNGYQVFSDEFYEKMLLVREEKKQKLEEQYKVIFSNEKEDTLQESYLYVMNAGQQMIIRNDMEKEPSIQDFSSIAYIGAGMLLAIAFLAIVTMVKDMGKKNDEDNNYSENSRNSKTI